MNQTRVSLDRDHRLSPTQKLADEFDDLRALVTISRTHPDDAGQRQVIVRIDDRAKRKIYFGESFTLEVPPGQHRLFAHNTLFIKRLAFAVEPGEHLEFIVVNRANMLTWSMGAILGSAPMFLRIYKRSVV